MRRLISLSGLKTYKLYKKKSQLFHINQIVFKNLKLRFKNLMEIVKIKHTNNIFVSFWSLSLIDV